MMSLAQVSDEDEVRVTAVYGGRRLRRRLADLGLNPGMHVRVIQHNGHGPIILGIKDARMAIGYGMAQKIMVEPTMEEHPAPRRHPVTN
jgi:ferrous iron transport protein A